ncbi:MAG: methyltransferase domain-containing protein [Thermodesulfobacteriota bacterium]
MQDRPGWYFEEMKLVGVDFCSPEVVAAYDRKHQRFRDYQQEAREILEVLGLGPGSTVLDMGAGTGAFAIHAAGYCKQVIAVDVSGAMLQYCRDKAATMGRKNISFVHSGFLTYQHRGEPIDAVVSVRAMHHLPDHWKQIGLERLAKILKPGGRLFLCDVVLPSQAEDLDGQLILWIKKISAAGGTELGLEAEIHLRREFSTYDWIMEGMLRRAGFSIEKAEYGDLVQARYLCRRQ